MRSHIERSYSMKRAALANASIAVLSIIAKTANGGAIFASEASHSSSDALVHGARYGAERSGIDQQKTSFRSFIAMSMLIPSGFLLHNATEAIQSLAKSEQSTANPIINGLGAMAVLGCNYYAYRQMNKIEHHSCASGASHSHAKNDLLVSAGFTAGLIMEATNIPFAENMSNITNAVLSGFAGVHLAVEAIDTLAKDAHQKHSHQGKIDDH